MSGKKIYKKILPEYYEAVHKIQKNFELRKDEDEVSVGDLLILQEWDGFRYTGRELYRTVLYVLRDCPKYGLMDGYCIIGF